MPDSSEESVSRLDLSQYRAGELAQDLTELMSVPNAIGKIVFMSIKTLAAVGSCCILIYLVTDVSGIAYLGISAYALVVGFMLGVMLGILRLIGHALLNVDSILKTVLETVPRF